MSLNITHLEINTNDFTVKCNGSYARWRRSLGINKIGINWVRWIDSKRSGGTGRSCVRIITSVFIKTTLWCFVKIKCSGIRYIFSLQSNDIIFTGREGRACTCSKITSCIFLNIPANGTNAILVKRGLILCHSHVGGLHNTVFIFQLPITPLSGDIIGSCNIRLGYVSNLLNE